MERPAPSTLAIVLAFLAVYVIWGSTYLAIRFAVETMPPFLMASSRWLIAGTLLYAWQRARGAPRPTARQWRSAAIVGGLLVVGGNGLVSFAERDVPSSLAALLIAVVPLWIALITWLAPGGRRPSGRVASGIAFGLAGVALLVGPAALAGISGTSLVMLAGILIILLASFSWASGSLYSRTADLPRSVLLGAGMEMLAGGAMLALLGIVTGETAGLDLAAVSARSWLSWGFLVGFGSIVAYSAYVWLLQVTRAELVATYAFVNPVVAVLLGILLAGEAFSGLTVVAAALIVVAVALVVTAPRAGAPAAPPKVTPRGPVDEARQDP